MTPKVGQRWKWNFISRNWNSSTIIEIDSIEEPNTIVYFHTIQILFSDGESKDKIGDKYNREISTLKEGDPFVGDGSFIYLCGQEKDKPSE